MRTVLELDHLITAEEFARLPKSDECRDYRWELVEGRVVRMSPPGARHGRVAVCVAGLLDSYGRSSGVGVAVGEAGYRLGSTPDTVRGPDVSFIRRERVPESGLSVGWGMAAPDLAVEILSPDNRMPEMRRKLAHYFEAGTQTMWVIDPDAQTVTVYERHAAPVTLGIGDTLEGGDVLPGLSCAVAVIFDGL